MGSDGRGHPTSVRLRKARCGKSTEEPLGKRGRGRVTEGKRRVRGEKGRGQRREEGSEEEKDVCQPDRGGCVATEGVARQRVWPDRGCGQTEGVVRQRVWSDGRRVYGQTEGVVRWEGGSAEHLE